MFTMETAAVWWCLVARNPTPPKEHHLQLQVCLKNNFNFYHTVMIVEFEQVVPSSSPAHGEDNGQLTSPALNEHVNTYKNGIRLFELFAGADDIFAHHEE